MSNNHDSKDLKPAAPSVSQNTKTDIASNNQTTRTTLQGMHNEEHEKIVSRTRGIEVEIGVGPHGRGPNSYGGLVSKNPFASAAQRGYMHANPDVLAKGFLDTSPP